MSATNGVKAAANGAAAKVETTTNLLPPKTEATVKTISPAKELLPLEDRLLRLDELFAIQNKYYKYKQSLEKLNAFKLKKDGETTTLSLEDDNRNSFETSNPEVVEDIINALKATITRKIKEIESKLTW
jgi:hypothetical protein